MATGGGGGGGGGFNFRLARAYVEIDVDMARYTTGLAQAQTRFNVFVSRLRADMGRLGAAFVAFRGISAGVGAGLAGVGAAAVHVRAVTTAVGRLNSQLSLAITRANRLAVALGRVRAAGGTTSSPAAMVRAWGASIASVLGGLGTGLERVLRGFGTGLGRVVNGLGGLGRLLSGFGTGLGRVLNGFGGGLGHILARGGLGLSRALRGSGGLGGLLTLPARLLGSLTSGLWGLLTLPARLLGGLGGLLTLPGRLLGALGNLVALPGRLVGAVTSLPGRLLGSVGLGGLVGGLGTAATAGYLASTAAGLESRRVALQRVSGLDARGSQALTDSIRRMAVELAGIPQEKLFDIAEMGARLGIEGPNLELFTRDIGRVGQVLAEIPIDEATTRIARLLAVFHQGPEAAIRLASALNRLDMASTASARDILDITSRLSGPASFLGMKPQQALALATALREAGVPLETGGTAMTQIMTRMASRKDSAKFARTAGMATAQFEATLGSDPLRAIKAFEEGLARIDKLQGPIAAVRVLDELHLDGQRVRGTILQLGRVMGQLNAYEEMAAREWEETSSIMGGAAKVTQTLSAQWVRLQNTFRIAVQDLATNLLPLFKGAVEGARMLTEDVGKAIAGSGEFIKGWAEWGGGLLRTLGLAVQRFETFVQLGKDFLGLQWERGVDVFFNILKRMKEIVKFEWTGLWNTGGSLDKVFAWVGKVFDYAYNRLVSLVNFLQDKLGYVVRLLVNRLHELLYSITLPEIKLPLIGGGFYRIGGTHLVSAPKTHILGPDDPDAGKFGWGGPLAPPPPGAAPGMPFGDKAGVPLAGPPFNPWLRLMDVFRVHEGVGKDRAAGIARGLDDLAKALNVRELAGKASTFLGGLREKFLRRGMEAASGRRFAGALPGGEEGGEEGGEAGAGAPAFPEVPAARAVARSRHREAIRAIQRRTSIPFAGDLGHDEVARRRSAHADFRSLLARRSALGPFAVARPPDPRVAAAVRRAAEASRRNAETRARALGPASPAARLRFRAEGRLLDAARAQRAFDAARAARMAGLPVPARRDGPHAIPGGIARRIARVRARRHAGEPPSLVARGFHALQDRLRNLGTFLTPEMRARAAQEAQKKRDQKDSADAIAVALGIPSGDFYRNLGEAVGKALKGVGALQ